MIMSMTPRFLADKKKIINWYHKILISPNQKIKRECQLRISDPISSKPFISPRTWHSALNTVVELKGNCLPL